MSKLDEKIAAYVAESKKLGLSLDEAFIGKEIQKRICLPISITFFHSTPNQRPFLQKTQGDGN